MIENHQEFKLALTQHQFSFVLKHLQYHFKAHVVSIIQDPWLDAPNLNPTRREQTGHTHIYCLIIRVASILKQGGESTHMFVL